MSDFEKAEHSEIIDELLFTVPKESYGKRVDQILHEFLPNYSRSRLQKWIENQQLRVNNEILTVCKKKLNGGEELLLTILPNPEELAFEPQPIDLNIIYEDDAILVINKPVGLVVHPANGNWSGTLLNGLLYYCPSLRGIPRAGIVHRLDKDTSGLMVVAKTLESQNHLVQQLQSRTVKREYIALVYGLVNRQEFTINESIGRHPTTRIKMAVTHEGKEAITHISVQKRFEDKNLTLLKCSLATGRTHQIRVHCAFVNHALVGDSTYCHYTKGYKYFIDFPRQALHAQTLSLIHPTSQLSMSWTCDLADDFKNLLDNL